ncbi:hypothetical protein G5I_12597 [Acromyrmex echinatior]|uniref:Uncharacterized protein n=1 Tax=Acromyrmex echinatior TaxID=103372 RepID=F4X2R6_ACREC|nr:hypothetical protein G5I_12597 [Acromyrmex echinatior]
MRLSSHWPTQPVCIDIAVGNDQEGRMEMEIMLPPASPEDPAENGSHLANADGDGGSFCSGSDGTPERFVSRFIAKKIGRVTAKFPTPSIIDRRRHRTKELSATAKWRLSGIVSGAPTAAAGTAGSPLRSPFGEQNFSTNLLAYSAIRKSVAFSEGEGAKERKKERKDGRKEGGTNACA